MDTLSKKLHYLPLQRSFEVTRGHQPSFANNFWSKRDRDVELVSVRLSWPGESSDMQYDPFRSSRDLGLTRPEVKLWPWPLKVILYMVRRALTRQTRWYQIRCSIFKIKDFIVEKPFWKIWEFWPLETPILTWAKKWPKWFRNDFSRAFERCLSFFSTATRSRDHGGGGVQTPPPPPSRRWKIQRPNRARVNSSNPKNNPNIPRILAQIPVSQCQPLKPKILGQIPRNGTMVGINIIVGVFSFRVFRHFPSNLFSYNINCSRVQKLDLLIGSADIQFASVAVSAIGKNRILLSGWGATEARPTQRGAVSFSIGDICVFQMQFWLLKNFPPIWRFFEKISIFYLKVSRFGKNLNFQIPRYQFSFAMLFYVCGPNLVFVSCK